MAVLVCYCSHLSTLDYVDMQPMAIWANVSAKNLAPSPQSCTALPVDLHELSNTQG